MAKKIVIENEKVKGTDITPKKIGETQQIYVPLRENGFFGGFVEFDKKRKPLLCIEDRLSTLRICGENKEEYSEVNAYAKARRNSKKYKKQGTLTDYYYMFIDFYKI
jgi:hypothetical protein